jgi:hypothetical protein
MVKLYIVLSVIGNKGADGVSRGRYFGFTSWTRHYLVLFGEEEKTYHGH